LLLTARDPVSMKVAQTLNAINDDNEFMPIRGRVREKVPLDKNGYILYCLIAKNVLAKIIEEENVKIEMDGAENSGKENAGGGSRLVIYAVALVGVILLLFLLIYALL
jgi:hypothetical protein